MYGEAGAEPGPTYVEGIIETLARSSHRGFGFNMLSLCSDPEKRRPDLYYAYPCGTLESALPLRAACRAIAGLWAVGVHHADPSPVRDRQPDPGYPVARAVEQNQRRPAASNTKDRSVLRLPILRLGSGTRPMTLPVCAGPPTDACPSRRDRPRTGRTTSPCTASPAARRTHDRNSLPLWPQGHPDVAPPAVPSALCRRANGMVMSVFWAPQARCVPDHMRQSAGPRRRTQG